MQVRGRHDVGSGSPESVKSLAFPEPVTLPRLQSAISAFNAVRWSLGAEVDTVIRLAMLGRNFGSKVR